MAVKKRKTSKRTKRGKNSFLSKEIGIILIFAGGVFLFLTDLGLMGALGGYIRSIEKGLFGQAYGVFAVFIIIFAVLMYKERGKSLRRFKLLGLTLSLIAVAAIFDLMLGDGSAGIAKTGLAAYYHLAAAGLKGGGVIGSAAATGLRSAVGYVGAYFCLIVILIICVVVMTEKSVVSAAKKGAKKTIEGAKAVRERSLHPKAIDLSQPSKSETIETESEMYLRYGREIIGNGQPGLSDLKDVREPLRRKKPKLSEAPSEIGLDTAVLGAINVEPEKSIPVSIKELSYLDDSVPFSETREEKYISYAGILKEGAISAETAGVRGFAAGKTGEIAPVAEPEPEPEPEPKPAPKDKVSESREEKTDTITGGKTPEKPYRFPSVKLLSRGGGAYASGRDEILSNAAKLEQVLKDFGVGVTVTNIIRGPRVSRYELIPDTGVKVSRITALEGDIKLALAASELRIEAPVPGKSAVGIEVPNSGFRTVRFRDICETDEFKNAGSVLSWGLGLDIQGLPVIADIAKMPHVLVAGTTGSGKSVGINTLIMSVLFKSTPDEVRLILIDPKVVELSVYNGIPHLLTEVVTKPDRALSALNWAVAEMNKRYRLFNESSTRNISGYNEKVEKTLAGLPPDFEGEKPSKLPLILIIIDELSELMMHSKKDVEQAIVSLSQLARAAGIHLVVATQRPSVDVVTGLIKSNIPSRVAYRLPSAVDSRTILDQSGAETLLGNGDMLYKPGDKNAPERVQGAFLSDEEVEAVVDFVKKRNAPGSDQSRLDEDLNTQMEFDFSNVGAGDISRHPERDEYFSDAGRLIISSGKASIGTLQRKFKIGFNRAARIMDQLHEAGVVSDSEGTKERRILMSIEEFEEYLQDG